MLLAIATRNRHKFEEFKKLFSSTHHQLSSQIEWGIESPEENGFSFVENALIKARHLSAATNMPTIADDSGLVIDALQGAPGIHSACYAGNHATDRENLIKLQSTLKNHNLTKPDAYFICVLALLRHAYDPAPIIVQAKWHGVIHEVAQGTQGFGYDPIFWIPKLRCTAAQLTSEVKNQLSHRGKAVQKLLLLLKKNNFG